ncbi:MAG: alpha/beta fold hydrolase [Elusimicrobia bacterium]|nr:alpha/beta fold hydrolase [Elusimicrobiota bacterium]
MAGGDAALRAHEAAGRFVQVDGLRVFSRWAGPAAGTPVLLTHGIPHSSFLYRRMIGPLSERHPVRAWDLPGFGLSEKPDDPRRYSFPEFERLFGLYVDAIGAERVHLVCHDIGGPFTIGWAARNPARVASLTVMDTTLTLGDFRLPSVVAAGIALPWALQGALLSDEACAGLLWRFARRRALARPEALDGEDGDAFRRLIVLGGGRRALTRTIKSYLRVLPYLAGVRRALAGFDRPVQLVWGAQDPFCTLAVARRLAALVPGARLCVLEGASHFVPEDEPEAAARAVLELVEGAAP